MLTFEKASSIILANLTNKALSQHFTGENLATYHYSLYLKRSSPLNRVISRKIGQLLQAGIIKKFEDERFEAIKRASKQHVEDNAEILTLEHLGLCFFAILICLGLSCIVFVIECFTGFWCR
jgi:hypothetical protein